MASAARALRADEKHWRIEERSMIQIVVMGVTGVGKTTVGRLLAERLQARFVDADDFHPPENVAKMSAGIPLTDVDREPWLDALNAHLRTAAAAGESVVLA